MGGRLSLRLVARGYSHNLGRKPAGGKRTGRPDDFQRVVGTAWAWGVCLLLTAMNSSVSLFYVAGGCFGLLLGFLWTATRPALLGLTPPGEEGRLFGLYALANKSAAVVGPLVWGLTALVAGSLGPARYRLAVGILGIFCLGGAAVLSRVRFRPKPATPPEAAA